MTKFVVDRLRPQKIFLSTVDVANRLCRTKNFFLLRDVGCRPKNFFVTGKNFFCDTTKLRWSSLATSKKFLVGDELFFVDPRRRSKFGVTPRNRLEVGVGHPPLPPGGRNWPGGSKLAKTGRGGQNWPSGGGYPTDPPETEKNAKNAKKRENDVG